MAISINWPTGVIFVPRADMTLIQSVPSEIRQLDLNSFRLTLKDLEDSDEGMPFPKTHNHNTEVLLSGIVYARIISILPPYSIEFEDGQYAVNCVGANHNIADVKIVNQVSLIVNNAAGLISNGAIEYSSFQGEITVSLSSPYFGTTFPTGTLQAPVNNFTDAILIGDFRGLSEYFILGNATLDNGQNFIEHQFRGQSVNLSTITVADDAQVTNCEFYNCTLTGILDGGSLVRDAIIEDLNYVNGLILRCMLNPGTIVLGGGGVAHFIDCYSGVPGVGTPVIDCGGSGQALTLRSYNGGIKLINKTGVDFVSIDLNSGQVILDNTVTNGTVVVRGIGKLIDTLGNPIPTGTWNGVTIINETVGVQQIVDQVSGSLTVEQANQLKRVYQSLMLDPTKPVRTQRLSSTLSKVTFDDVVIDITGPEDSDVLATRQP